MELKRRTSESLLRKLAFGCLDAKSQAVCEIRLFSKWDMDNRICLAEAGAIPLLLEMLTLRDSKIQENAITALLNLSIYPGNREAIIDIAGGIDAIVQVIKEGLTSESKANAAAVLFSLLVEKSFRPLLGSSHTLVPALLDLVRSSSSRCKMDAIKALFHLALCTENRARLVSAGAVPVLLSLLIHQKGKLTEDALAVLAQIADCPEGASVLLQASAVSFFVTLVDKGSTPRIQENAASALLNLCRGGGGKAIEEVLERKRSVPVIHRLLEFGSARGREKAESLIKILNIR